MENKNIIKNKCDNKESCYKTNKITNSLNPFALAKFVMEHAF